jgi:hypothetical protein
MASSKAKLKSNGLKQGDALSPLLFNFALEDAMGRVQVDQERSKLNGHSRFWFMLMMLKHWAEAYIV